MLCYQKDKYQIRVMSNQIIPAMLLFRFILDTVCMLMGKTSHWIELIYFLLFMVLGGTTLTDGSLNPWGFIAFGLALFSLIQFFIKQKYASGDTALGDAPPLS